MARTTRVAAIQLSCTDSVQDNLDRTIAKIEEAKAKGAEFICLQELFYSLYFCQVEDHRFFDLAEPIPGPITERLQGVCKRLEVDLVAGLFERRAPGLYHNSSVTINRQGELVSVYRKMHIPDDPNYYEKFYFTPGDRGFRTAKTESGQVGVCICWDQWYPEAARITALKGAEFLVYPTAIGWLDEDKEEYGESQVDAWKTMMRSHAIANGVFVIAPNRVGRESNIQFWGNSFICAPNGVILAEASQENEELLIADCDLDLMDVVRTHWPFLRDRRIDAYSPIANRYLDEDKLP